MKKVVVVGGGFVGSRVSKALENKFDLTLVDTKDYFEFTPSILRTLVEPGHIKKIQVKHKDYLKKANIINDHAHELGGNYIKTSKENIRFDYLVIAVGSEYGSPIKEEDVLSAQRAEELRDYHHRLVESDSVAIIGGGLVGVELAAEICERFPKKKLFLIHSKDRLIERNRVASSEYCRKFLEKRGVNIILNERGIVRKKEVLLKNSDKKIKADLIFSAVGIKPNSECADANFSQDIDDIGCFRVNDFLQLSGRENIFVGGDVVGLREEKTAQAAERHAEVIVYNINAIESQRPLRKYFHKRRPLIISLGKRDGILETRNFILKGYLTSILKNFVEWKSMKGYL